MSIVFLIAGMIGGYWGFKLSDNNRGDASTAYGIAAALWCAACVSIAAYIATH